MNTLRLIGCLALAASTLAGCAQTDPYLRPGMWQPTGANTLNLAAMVANPHDLIRGRGTTGMPGIEAAPPVTRYWAGKPVVLPTTSSQADGTGQGRADSSGAAAGTGSAAAN